MFFFEGPEELTQTSYNTTKLVTEMKNLSLLRLTLLCRMSEWECDRLTIC